MGKREKDREAKRKLATLSYLPLYVPEIKLLELRRVYKHIRKL
jgi:hypothetical protein